MVQTRPEFAFARNKILIPAQPSKKLTQPSRKSRTALAAKKEENFDGASDRDGGKADEGWGWNDDWTDPNEGNRMTAQNHLKFRVNIQFNGRRKSLSRSDVKIPFSNPTSCSYEEISGA